MMKTEGKKIGGGETDTEPYSLSRSFAHSFLRSSRLPSLSPPSPHPSSPSLPCCCCWPSLFFCEYTQLYHALYSKSPHSFFIFAFLLPIFLGTLFFIDFYLLAGTPVHSLLSSRTILRFDIFFSHLSQSVLSRLANLFVLYFFGFFNHRRA
ncbi:hypothetical protein B9Z19DRAFT_723653 [Tuber borchii]|uniref:Uncharacterized protein n=1 Tax=Tuber borchii TaxID=42251 RepID=A0A2T6ZYL2_TUBBO|nr:hypothetical protein B9Z19DRAFT_723653 [Tuber borchii]